MELVSTDSTQQVTTEEISVLVDAFYGRVQLDPLIGPIFNREVEDWPAHLGLLKEFWATVILGTRSFKGNPMEIHLKLLPEPRHFERWLELFAETANEVLTPAHAELFVGKSQRIAETFQRAIASHRSGLGVMPV
jgi:hemoglobin